MRFLSLQKIWWSRWKIVLAFSGWAHCPGPAAAVWSHVVLAGS